MIGRQAVGAREAPSVQAPGPRRARPPSRRLTPTRRHQGRQQRLSGGQHPWAGGGAQCRRQEQGGLGLLPAAAQGRARAAPAAGGQAGRCCQPQTGHRLSTAGIAQPRWGRMPGGSVSMGRLGCSVGQVHARLPPCFGRIQVAVRWERPELWQCLAIRPVPPHQRPPLSALPRPPHTPAGLSQARWQLGAAAHSSWRLSGHLCVQGLRRGKPACAVSCAAASAACCCDRGICAAGRRLGCDCDTIDRTQQPHARAAKAFKQLPVLPSPAGAAPGPAAGD